MEHLVRIKRTSTDSARYIFVSTGRLILCHKIQLKDIQDGWIEMKDNYIIEYCKSLERHKMSFAEMFFLNIPYYLILLNLTLITILIIIILYLGWLL